ncbi:MAG: Rrf2 family transcriptional regulator [Chitinispirillaceae bacterium]|nr:Rrf2 family transcriptional regulator [Chitinispirillaceae bacterium]
MKLSTKCRYGLRAAVAIAKRYGKSPAKRKEIAKNEGLSSSYLENILLVLRNHKIVETNRGVKGGYILCRKPSEITAYEVINALDGPLSIVDCVEKPGGCGRTKKCVTHFVWCELAESMRGILANITLQDLIDKEQNAVLVDYSI